MSGTFRKLVDFPLGAKTSKQALVSNDIPNLAQVQSLVQGLSAVKEAVATDSHVHVDIATGGLLSLEGYQLQDQDRVLLSGQTDPIDNGIYVADIGAWSRATDADEAAELQPNTQVGILFGDDAGRTYKLNNTVAPVVGTDAQNWIVTSSSSSAALDVVTDQSDFVQISGANVQAALDSVDDRLGILAASAAADNLDTNDALGITVGTGHLGLFSGAILSDNADVKQLLGELEAEIEAEAQLYDLNRFESGSTLLSSNVSMVFTHNLGVRYLSGVRVYNLANGEDITHSVTIIASSINALTILNEDADVTVVVAARA